MRNYPYYQDDRSFLFPFLLGGLAGGAVVGLTRPRPVYNNMPGFNPYLPSGGYSYYNYYPINNPSGIYYGGVM